MISSLQTNAKQVAAALRRAVSQIPYATARAVNKTALDVQKAEQENLADKQTIRTDWWKPGRRFGINVRFATKQKPTAVVGSQADWLKLQEEGGTKRPKGKTLGVPTEEHRGGKLGVMKKAKRPRAVLAKPRAFIAKMQSGIVGIWRRVTKARLPIKLLFTLTPSAKVKKVLGFKERGEAEVAAKYDNHFTAEYTKALKDFKPKSK